MTSKLGLTPEEEAVVAYFARGAGDVTQRILWHFATIGPSTALAVYGMIKHEDGALVVAFFVMAAIQLIRTPSEARYAKLYRSIFAKIDTFERSESGRTS
jgi:predicted cobalt transporter CbtA